MQLQEEIPKPPPQVIQRVEQPKQQIMQVQPSQQVDPLPPTNVEVHKIHIDLEEENDGGFTRKGKIISRPFILGV